MATRSSAFSRRRWTRRKTLISLRTVDAKGAELGVITDIGVRGATILHKGTIPTGGTFSINITLPEPLATYSPLVFDTVCRWTVPDVMPGYQRSGLEFVDMTTDQLIGLERVFDEFTSGRS
jgi:hypothetical protein